MQVEILNLDGKSVGKVELSDSIFGIDPRADILHRVVTWQRANARAGTHAVKTVSDVAGSGKKAFKQKKTGNAREGERYNVHMRGGGVVHGPVVRDHNIDLPKKIRSLGLKMALSSKVKEGALIVIDSEKMSAAKTNTLAKQSVISSQGSTLWICSHKEVKVSVVTLSSTCTTISGTTTGNTLLFTQYSFQPFDASASLAQACVRS